MPTQPVILAIETGTRSGSVCLARGAVVQASVSGDASSSHSTDLIENVDRVLRDAQIDLASVAVFAAAVGPGSFTGLRIGLATVKSLAVSMKRKCIGISTLAAVAAAAGESNRTIALLPAGRGEVFAQMFTVGDGDVMPLDKAAHLSPALLLAKYAELQALRWAGEGAHQQLENLRTEADRRGISLELNVRAPSEKGWSIAPPCEKLAEAVARLALRDWQSGKLTDPQDLQANYLRASDAEINAHV